MVSKVLGTTLVVSDPWLEELGKRVVDEARSKKLTAQQEREAAERARMRERSKWLKRLLLERLELNLEIPDGCDRVQVGALLFMLGRSERNEACLSVCVPCGECGEVVRAIREVGSREHLGQVLSHPASLCPTCYANPDTRLRYSQRIGRQASCASRPDEA